MSLIVTSSEKLEGMKKVKGKNFGMDVAMGNLSKSGYNQALQDIKGSGKEITEERIKTHLLESGCIHDSAKVSFNRLATSLYKLLGGE